MSFKIYSSSAGSGKTYTLTKEYLKIVLNQESPDYFKHILAITFTNDAANEMKVRILKELKGFAFPEKLSEKERQKSQFLLQEIAQENQQDESIVAKRAEKVFLKIIYHYSDFSVSTIDSFVNNVIGAFTRELDLPYNYEISMDSKMIRQAIDLLLEDIGKAGKELFSEIVLRWVMERIKNNQAWTRIAKELTDFVQRDVNNEKAYAHINSLKDISLEAFKVLDDDLQTYQATILERLQNLAKKALKIIENQGVSLDDFKSKSNGVGHYFRRIAENSFSQGLIKDFFKKGRKIVLQALDGDWYAGKTANAAIDAISLELTEILVEIEQIRENEREAYEIAELVKKNLYKLALIQEIEREFVKVKKENQAIHISDTNKKIAQVVASEPVPFIYERVGQRYSHILIDEFQDTSVLQWLNLLPLVENNLAEKKFNLIVGDAKQAIYGWRGGEMEQLVRLYKNQVSEMEKGELYNFPFLEERYAVLQQHYEPQRLSKNFRSSQEVVMFNNDFFSTLVRVMKGTYPLLESIYDEGFQQETPPNAKSGGHVEITFIEKPSQNGKEIYIENTIQKVQQYLDSLLVAGFKWKDIAILCRTNRQGRQIAQHLERQGIPLISRDSLLLSSDEKVGFIIALLHLMAFPKDRLHKSEVLYLFYKAVRKEIPDENIHAQIKELLEKPLLDLLSFLAVQGYHLQYIELQQLGLYELVEKFIEVFKLLENQPGLEYLFRFLDLVLEFSQQSGSNLVDFLEYWQEQKDSLSVTLPEGNDAITLTTIHRAKGLEFPVVILPFVDWKLHLDGKKDKIWVEIPETFQEQFQQNALKTTLISANQDLESTPFAQKYHYEAERKFIENLNLLYVAFTRPIYRLYIIGQKSKKWEDKYAHELIGKYLIHSKELTEIPDQYFVYEGEQHITEKHKSENTEHFFHVKELISTDIHRKFRTPKADSYDESL